MKRAPVLAALAAALLVAGCGGPSADAPPPPAAVSAAHDAADVTFATQMIPHHQQAVQMADLVAGHGASEQVTQLAARIKAAQAPEITRMQGFLTTWGAPPAGDASGMGGMANGTSMAMPGMMSGAQMTELGHSSGAAFDRMFLQMMIAHHQGAVDMAKTELAAGQNPQATALAQQILTSQQGEIAEMHRMLGG